MSSELISLSILFQNRLFRIPDYQRGYAWKKEQLIDFWEDIINLPEDRYHYTGLLSLKKMSKEEIRAWEEDNWLIDIGYKAYHVVDGQQRLTTFSILMHELISLVSNLPENKGKSVADMYIGYESIKSIKEKYLLRKRPPEHLIRTYMFGYEIDNPSAKYLKHRIFKEPHGGTIDETYYTRNLLFAKNFFAQNLQSFYETNGLAGIEALYRKLTLKLMFNLHEIEDDYDVFVAFETMNNRGKSLSNLELLKNRLIYLTTLFDDCELDDKDKDQLRKNINDAWKEIYRQLGRNQNHPLADDEFLRAHWAVYFQYTRRRGDDYIRFLLNKFSSKNVFDKHTVDIGDEVAEPMNGDDDFEADEPIDDIIDEPILVSKLAPSEIRDYVHSLKDFSEHWYYSFFPYDSDHLTNDEKVWINKLNRIGIVYFRPLVAIILSISHKTTAKQRVRLLQEIERFIFLTFRVAGFNASYKSSHYYNKARRLLQGSIDINHLIDDLKTSIKNNKNSIITNFTARISSRFDSGSGFYGWRDLRYFLYEYESRLSNLYNIQKVDWRLFTRAEKDKVTIEHILPQTPTKWYWRNQFRHYNEEEIKFLSGSLGNLLPLAQSKNSSLQNDSFPEKKNPTTKLKGYVNGSHSEIEVAAYEDWNAEAILERGLVLLEFMEYRWKINLSDEEKIELLHIGFVQDDRDDIPELTKPETDKMINISKPAEEKLAGLTETEQSRYNFWHYFVEYCRSNGRGEDIASQKPFPNHWYDVIIGSSGYHLFFQVIRRKILRIGIYVYNQSTFNRLESMKENIEKMYGEELEWYTSSETSKAKRILHSVERDIFNKENYLANTQWLITQFDGLKQTLIKLDPGAFALEQNQPDIKTDKALISKKHQKANHISQTDYDESKEEINRTDNNNQPTKRSTITNEMVPYAYAVAKKVYEGKLGRTEGRDKIAEQVNMNQGSAGDYISAFAAMVNGERYTRTLNEFSTRYFLEKIVENYGQATLEKALNACSKHASYYASFGRGRLAYVERIIDEYEG